MILLRTPFYFSAVGLSLCSSSPSDFLFLYSRRHWHIIGFTLLSTPWVLSPALTFYSPAGRLTSYHTLFVWHGDWMGLWLKKRESRFSRNGSYFFKSRTPMADFQGIELSRFSTWYSIHSKCTCAIDMLCINSPPSPLKFNNKVFHLTNILFEYQRLERHGQKVIKQHISSFSRRIDKVRTTGVSTYVSQLAADPTLRFLPWKRNQT